MTTINTNSNNAIRLTVRIETTDDNRSIDLTIPSSSQLAEAFEEIIALAGAPLPTAPWEAVTAAGQPLPLFEPLSECYLTHGDIIILRLQQEETAPVLLDTAESLAAETTATGTPTGTALTAATCGYLGLMIFCLGFTAPPTHYYPPSSQNVPCHSSLPRNALVDTKTPLCHTGHPQLWPSRNIHHHRRTTHPYKNISYISNRFRLQLGVSLNHRRRFRTAQRTHPAHDSTHRHHNHRTYHHRRICRGRRYWCTPIPPLSINLHHPNLVMAPQCRRISGCLGNYSPSTLPNVSYQNIRDKNPYRPLRWPGSFSIR